MSWLVDLLYFLLVVITAPAWIMRMIRSGKIRTDWPGRFGRTIALPSSPGKRLLIHGVSVGEINAIRLLVDHLREVRPDLHIVISTTTDTGFARARDLFATKHVVVRYPFDFSFCVRRFLDAVRPDVVALVELEVWPNFTAACSQRDIPVGIINGRLTERSFRRYQLFRPLVRPSFGRLAFTAVQSETYARRFRKLGVKPDGLHVSGTMKWDTAEIADVVEGADRLAREMGIDRSQPLIVAGSTAPGEHELLVKAVPDRAQLLCAPRKPEWFDQAARALPGCARRSKGQCNSSTGRFLLDTIGELRMAYSLADIVVVGRSFGHLHGSDMMEPVALGKAVIIGPAVSDFQQTMDALLDGDGIVQVTLETLSDVIHELLENKDRRQQLAENGRKIILAQQGATLRHTELIYSLLEYDRVEPRPVT